MWTRGTLPPGPDLPYNHPRTPTIPRPPVAPTMLLIHDSVGRSNVPTADRTVAGIERHATDVTFREIWEVPLQRQRRAANGNSSPKVAISGTCATDHTSSLGQEGLMRRTSGGCITIPGGNKKRTERNQPDRGSQRPLCTIERRIWCERTGQPRHL